MLRQSYLLRLIVGCLLTILILAACDDASTPTTSGPTTAANNRSVGNNTSPKATPAPLSPGVPASNPRIGYADSPIAQVDNQTIAAGEFNHALDQSRIEYEQGSGGGLFDWSTAANQQVLHDLRGQTLEGLINFVVIAEQAAKENVTVSEAEVEARLTGFKQQLGNDPSAYPNWLAQHFLSEADERAELKQTILFEKMNAAHSGNVPNKADQVHVRFILVATQPEATDLYNKLKSGTDFSALARQFSLDPGTATNGGDLGFIFMGGTDPAFEKTAFALQTNQISSPVKTALGWNIIQALGHETRPLPFDLVQQHQAEAFATYIKTLRDQAKIEELLKP